MSKSRSPSLVRSVVNRSTAFALCRCGAAAVMLAALTACSESKPVGTIGYVKGFGGMAAADEPRAVLLARDILSAGGSAADAAVTMYFTMAVTQPSTATLGGGGACVVYDKDKRKIEALDFVAPSSSVTGTGTGMGPGAGMGMGQQPHPNAVPANVRGFYALHAKYGHFRWEHLLGEAERLARAGVPVSRSFAADLNRAASLIANDPNMRRVFMPNGRLLAEGQTMTQTDLATTLSRIRRAPGDLYVGGYARDFADQVTRSGGTLSSDDLRDMKPAFVEPLSVALGHDTAYFAPPPAVGSAVMAQMVAVLANRWKDTAEEEKSHLFAETAARVMADRSRWMLPNGWDKTGQVAQLTNKDHAVTIMTGYAPDQHVSLPAPKANDAIPAASFVALDSYGGAVACGVTPYGLFGNGRMVPGTGIVLAGSPGVSSGPASVTPMVVINPHSQEIRMVLSASGGVTAGTSGARLLLSTLIDGQTLEQAMGAPRLHHSGNPDVVFTESGDRTFDPAPLVKRGHEIKPLSLPSRVNALLCGSGAANFENCRAATDPRGFGLAAVIGKD